MRVNAGTRKGSEPDHSWNFFDALRFEHVNIVAKTGRGKTTLLSALINEDLDKVARGEASVFVLDSQGEHLSYDLPRLARFGPGGDLEGKLIYLEPDLAHPLALNIFDFEGFDHMEANEQYELLNDVEHALRFFIGSGFGDMSGPMQNIIGYCLPFIARLPRATVFTFKRLLDMDEKAFAAFMQEHPDLSQKLEPDVIEFVAKDMRRPNYAPTLGAIRSRLNHLTQNALFRAFFRQPENKLDLFELLKEPHVIVVHANKKLLRDVVTEAFGRYFFAALLRVVQQRVDGGLPCYFYTDEAHQYIAYEEAVVEFINEARRQQLSLCLAYHRSADIKIDSIREALVDAEVQIRPGPERYHWYVAIGDDPPLAIKPPPVDFRTMPKMRDEHWAAILDDMHRRFCHEPKRPTAAPSSRPDVKNILVPPLPSEDATTER